MTKRSTIGENPLDLLISGNTLDTVVPGPAASARTARVEERLDQLEAGVQGLKAELARDRSLEEESGRLKGELNRLQAEMTRLKGEVERFAASPPLPAELAPLKAEVAQLKAEVAQLRGKLTPSDIPWWMGGRKK